jgi:hypothetical protein
MGESVSINVNIDKKKLVREIASVIALPNVSQFPLNADISYDNGWLKVKFNSQGYARVDGRPNYHPYGQLVDLQYYLIIATYYIKTLASPYGYYLNFLERSPGDAYVEYHGFYLDTSGRLEARTYPGSLTGTASGTVNAGDIVILGIGLGRYGGNYFFTYGACKYDWDSGVCTQIINAYSSAISTPGANVLYHALAEQDLSVGELYIATFYRVDSSRMGSAPTAGIGSDVLITAFNSSRLLRRLSPRVSETAGRDAGRQSPREQKCDYKFPRFQISRVPGLIQIFRCSPPPLSLFQIVKRPGLFQILFCIKT